MPKVTMTEIKREASRVFGPDYSHCAEQNGAHGPEFVVVSDRRSLLFRSRTRMGARRFALDVLEALPGYYWATKCDLCGTRGENHKMSCTLAKRRKMP